MGLPTDSTHLSDQPSADLIDEFLGMVDVQFHKSSQLREFFGVKIARGTDTVLVRRVGRPTLIALTAGVRPDATATGQGKASVTVDTVILARDNHSMLNDFQSDFGVRTELAQEQGKELAKFFDQALMIKVIKGAGMSAPSGLNGAFGAGKTVTLSSAGDELDPDKLYTAITGRLTAMAMEDIDIAECMVAVPYTYFDVLLNNNKLTSSEYSSGNANVANNVLYRIKGVPIMATARIPSAAITGHKLSNTANSNGYDVSATEAKTVALIMHPMSLLIAESISLTSEIWFNKEEKQWFIDSYIAFGADVRRPDVCGRVLKA